MLDVADADNAGLQATLQVLSGFNDVSPELLAARALLRRVDRKYVLPRPLLESLLTGLDRTYDVLRSAGQLVATYQTSYFDTPERRMYEDHRRDRRPRFKVRIRHHVDRQMSFLEVKRKGANQRTTKARMRRAFGETTLDDEARRFIDEHCSVGATSLGPCLSIGFHRITLVGRDVNERITIDVNLELRNEVRQEQLHGLVIAEVKQGRFANGSPAVRALRDLRIRERALSKYCLATARLTSVRLNRLKADLRAVEHTTG
jgi:hypothetical protein